MVVELLAGLLALEAAVLDEPEVDGSDLMATAGAFVEFVEVELVDAELPPPVVPEVEADDEETGSFLISVAESAARIASATMSFFFWIKL